MSPGFRVWENGTCGDGVVAMESQTERVWRAKSSMVRDVAIRLRFWRTLVPICDLLCCSVTIQDLEPVMEELLSPEEVAI